MRPSCLVYIFSFLIFAPNIASATACLEYGKKSVACYELGHLDNRYDETGIGCGDQAGTYIWTVEPSYNSSIQISTTYTRENGYPGGRAWESGCYVRFSNEQGKLCSYEMLVSLGTEDASIDIYNFRCK